MTNTGFFPEDEYTEEDMQELKELMEEIGDTNENELNKQYVTSLTSTLYKSKSYLKENLGNSKNLSLTECMLLIAEKVIQTNWTDVAIFDIQSFKAMPANGVAIWCIFNGASYLCPLYVDIHSRQSPEKHTLLEYAVSSAFHPSPLSVNKNYKSQFSEGKYYLIIKGSNELRDAGKIYEVKLEDLVCLIYGGSELLPEMALEEVY